MQLTTSQLRVLRYYHDHRTKGPTVGGFLYRFAKVLILWIAFAVVGSWILFEKEIFGFAYLLIGIFVGAILREIRHLIWAMQVWPILVAITNWQRVEELLPKSSGPGTASD
jgi:hypothetical protein